MKNKRGSLSRTSSGDNMEPTSTRRRHALKRLATGGAIAGAAAAMPSRWTRPVVESVMLPAHAQISGEPDGDFFLSVNARAPQEQPAGNAGTGLARWVNWLIPSARAGATQLADCVACNTCGRLRSGQLTATMYLTPLDTNTLIACFEATGGLGDTVTPSPVSGGGIVCIPPAVTFVSLQGVAPDRKLTVNLESEQVELFEDPNRTCSCAGLGGCGAF